MSAIGAQPSGLSVAASRVLDEARALAFETLDPAACLLVDAVRLCFVTDSQAISALGRACRLVTEDAQVNEAPGVDAEPWPCPQRELFWRLAALLGQELKQDRKSLHGWARFRALRDRAEWLAIAAKLETRDGHVMRRPGGLRLAPSAFNGERMRAQVLAVRPSPGVPGGDVLRITWEDNGRLVTQSKPGCFVDVDPSAEPE